jgi:hypothetical protein
MDQQMDFPLKTIPLAKAMSQNPKCNIKSFEKGIH